MTELTPYADDATSVTIGGLTIENGRERVAIYGKLDLGRSKAGLSHAKALKAVLDAAVQALEAAGSLPDHDAPPTSAATVKNPFG